MNRLTRFCFLIGILIFCSNILYAGTFRHYSVETGLSSRRVFQVNKDTTGFMWFFTSQGVDRYDGTEVRRYTLNKAEDILENMLPFTVMTLDRQKNLWVSLRGGQIYSYNKQTDNFDLHIDLHQSMVERQVRLNNIFFDTDNRLWMCLSSGLYYYDFEKGEPVLVSDFGGTPVAVMEQFDEHTFFVGTYETLYRIREEKGNVFSITKETLALSGNARVEALYASKNKLYVGTFSKGAYAIDFTQNKTIPLPYVPNAPVRAITSALDDIILIGTDGSGFFSVDAKTNQLLNRYTVHEDIRSSLAGNTVSDIYVDERNHVWITTSTNGVSVLDPYYPEIKLIKHEHMNNNSLLSNHVNVIMEDSDGDMWYGTNNGVSVYLKKSNRWMHFLDNKDADVEQNAVVLAICEDRQKNVWVGGFGIGAYCINKQNRSIRKIPRKEDLSTEGITTNYVYDIATKGDYVWFGGIEGNLSCYNLATKEYAYYTIDCIGDIYVTDDNKLLLATCTGLAMIDEGERITWFRNFNGQNLSSSVRCLTQTPLGDIYMATDGKGLLKFNMKTTEAEFLTVGDDLSSNTINNVLCDDKGCIWFSTEETFYRFDPEDGTITQMNDYLGISSGNFNPNACLKKRDGSLSLGTADGVVEFSPDFTIENIHSLQLLFTDFSLFYKTVHVGEEGSPLKQSIDKTTDLNLKYAQNSFSLSFSSINYIYPDRIQYMAKLNGFDENQYPVPNSRTVRYTNLQPGKYNLQVWAVNSYTKQIVGEKSLDIIIGKPFWLSRWAFFIYFILFCAITSFVLLYIRNRIKERNSREKINFFVDIAHDIRTPVSLIKAPLSELEEREQLSDYGKKTLSLAIQNADKLFSMITQLLDFQKADRANAQITLSEHDLYTYIQEKITSFSVIAAQKDIELQLESTFNELVVWFDRNKMDKIINNILSNAIKYTIDGSVVVRLDANEKEWSIEVKDTGIGIPSNEQKSLFKQFYRAENAINSQESGSGIGLLLAKKLVHLHHGTIAFSSAENVGSSFKIVFPREEGEAKVAEAVEVPEVIETTVIAPSQETILVVEDNDEMREYLVNTLSQEYHVFSVSDGTQALDQVQKINPDIIISDILMPNMKGDEMCRILKSSMETSHISVILLTALSEKENIIGGLESGADDYVLKPFDTSVLKARIKNILHSRRKLRKQVLSSDAVFEDVNYSNLLDKEFLDNAVNVIESELSNPDFSINEFCKALGMSRTSVYNKIKTLTDQGPNDFIRIIRLKKAKELLKSRKYSIAEVSLMVGFSDAKYFSTSFKKQFGISPSKVGD